MEILDVSAVLFLFNIDTVADEIFDNVLLQTRLFIVGLAAFYK
jgi:hypothetical protein